ncbi:hypothetical protein CBER1_06930 [Cercospora berteroae]|uniref:Uncharacterized protein n=1 Tax=Cercospora berteroae TaxID=357750 RepID=A0A2S6C3Z8_9PEZI|nr:hypothetical protein CBER1_06930 [Cercospora berteroae]
MGSFQQPDFIAPSDWDYGIPQNYTPGYVDDAMARQSSFGFGSTSDMSAGSNMIYVSQGYGPQSSTAATFHLPSGSASVRRHASSQRSTTSIEGDEDKPSRRIKRTRTVASPASLAKSNILTASTEMYLRQSAWLPNLERMHDANNLVSRKDDTMEKMVKLAETYNKTLASLNSDIDIMSATLRSIEARLNHAWPMAADIGGAGLFQHQHPPQQPPQNSVECWQQLNAGHSPSSSSSSFRRESQ